MKLEPIAKPIRIRIKLGKSEFSSLDDVKRNFSIEELYPLFKDGRLERWLVQIGEYNLANKVKEFSPKCGNGDMRDHILFLSLFFDKATKSFDETEISKESWFMTVETLSIYAATKGYNQNGLKSCINRIIDKFNITTVFENPNLHKAFSDNGEWGFMFASRIENNNDYKHYFSYLANYSGNTYNILQILQDFYKKANELGYDFKRVYQDEFTIDFAASYYKKTGCQSIGLDWGILFADLLQDWDHDGEKIINILKDDTTYLSSFNNHCLKLGKKTADPWYQIANSYDYSDVCDVLVRFRYADSIKNKLEQTKKKVNTLSAIEVITFLEDLLLFHENPLSGMEKIEKSSYQSFLLNDWLILKRIHSNEKNLISSLNDIQDQNDFAKYLMDEETLLINDKSLRFFRAVFVLVGKVFVKRINNAKIK